MVRKLVLLVVVIGCSAEESWFSQFTAGLAHGRDNRMNCSEDPSACLAVLGRSLSFISSKEWTPALASLSAVPRFSPAVQSFIDGFASAVQEDPNAFNQCTNFLGTWLDIINMIAAADFQLLTVSQIVELACSAYYQIDGQIASACNLNDLIDALRTQSIHDYLRLTLKHSCVISSSIVALSQCSSNYYQCGAALGNITHVETGWNI